MNDLTERLLFRNASAIALTSLSLLALTGSTFAQAWARHAKLVPDLVPPDAWMGYSSAIHGDDLFYGAMNEGAVYAWCLEGGRLSFVDRLVPQDGLYPEQFGKSVSVDGSYLVVGRPADDIMSWNSGSAYVFEKHSSGWEEAAKLIPQDPFQLDNFGCSVSMSGARALIGAKYDDDRGHSSGSAYVFERVDGVWQQVAKLVAVDGAEGDLAGWSVAIDGSTAVVGAWGHSTDALFAGAAFVFEEQDGSWVQTATLTATPITVNAYFGVTVAIERDLIAVGATGETARRGAVHLFRRDPGGSQWSFEERLAVTGAGTGAEFGNAIDVDHGRVLVAAHRLMMQRGKAFLFQRDAGAWVTNATFVDPDSTAGDQFGWSAGLHGRRAVFGTPQDATFGSGTGAGHVFIH